MSDEVWAEFEERLRQRSAGDGRWCKLDPNGEHYNELSAFVDALRKIEQQAEERVLRQQAEDMGCTYDLAAQRWMRARVILPLIELRNCLDQLVEANLVLRTRMNDQAETIAHIGAIVVALQKRSNPQEVAS